MVVFKKDFEDKLKKQQEQNSYSAAKAALEQSASTQVQKSQKVAAPAVAPVKTDSRFSIPGTDVLLRTARAKTVQSLRPERDAHSPMEVLSKSPGVQTLQTVSKQHMADGVAERVSSISTDRLSGWPKIYTRTALPDPAKFGTPEGKMEAEPESNLRRLIDRYNADEQRPFTLKTDDNGQVSVEPFRVYGQELAQVEQEIDRVSVELQQSRQSWQPEAINKQIDLEKELQALQDQKARLEAAQNDSLKERYELENVLQQFNLTKAPEASKLYQEAEETQTQLEQLELTLELLHYPEPLEDRDPWAVASNIMEVHGLTARDLVDNNEAVARVHMKLTDRLTDLEQRLAEQGYDFSRMYEYRQRVREDEAAQAKQAEQAQFAKEHPVVASAASVLRAPLQGIEFVGKALEQIGNDPDDPATYVPPSTADMINTNFVNTVRGAVSEEIVKTYDWELFGQNVAAFLYQTTLSAVDSAATVGLLGPAATVVLGGSAAASTTADIINRGGTSEQAILGGLATGVAEGLFEKVSIDNLLKPGDVVNVRTWVREVLKQSGIEASEEVMTEITNIISDSVIMGQNSNFDQLVAAYEALGLTREEAEQKALLDNIGQVAWAGVGGALAGGMTAGVYRAVQGVQQSQATNKQLDAVGEAVRNANQTQDEIRKAQLLQVDGAADLAARQAAGGKISNRELGRVAVANQKAVEQLVHTALESQEPAVRSLATQMLTSEGETVTVRHMRSEGVAALQAVMDGSAVKQSEASAATATPVATTETASQQNTLDTITTGFTDMGMKLATAEKKAAVVLKLMTGETVTDKELASIDPTNKKVQALFSQMTGVVFPERISSVETLRGLYRSAPETMARQAETVVAEQQTEAVPDFQTWQAQNPVTEAQRAQAKETLAREMGNVMRDGSPVVGYTEFKERYRAANPGADDAAVAGAYQQFLHDEQTVLFDGKLLNRSMFHSEVRGRPGGQALTTAEINYMFDQMKDGNTDLADVLRETEEAFADKAEYRAVEAAEQERRTKLDATVKSLKRTLSGTLVKDIVLEDSIERVTGGKKVNAFVDLKTGVVHLNRQVLTSEQTLHFYLGHELTHLVKESAGDAAITDILDTFRKMEADGLIPNPVLAAQVRSMDQWLEDVRKQYGEVMKGDTKWTAEEEVAGDLIGRIFGEPEVLNAFTRAKSGLVDRIVQWLRGLVQKLRKSDSNQELTSTLEQLGDRFAEALKQYDTESLENETAVDTESEIRLSIEFDQKFMDKAEQKNNGRVEQSVMDQARQDREKIAAYLNEFRDELRLPPDVMGNTWSGNSSYGGSEENTTVCIRSMAADDLMDAVAEKLGRPLTVEDTITISQELFNFTDKPECLYCYVAMDRKAYRSSLGKYIQQRDAALEDLRSGMSYEEAFAKFLDGRKETKPMRERFKMWSEAENLISLSDLASPKRMAEATARDSSFAKQIRDAQNYARAAAWPKKQVGFAAYNNHILKWKQAKIDSLNDHYGMRMYSFSDYSPAFILEDMQRVTDAAVRGLKGLAYTKELDFVRVFAPSGMGINVSVFGYDDGNGGVAQDGMQGADWAETQALREQFPNVGATFVATNDAQVEWALEQDWIDVIIPFHMVRTGSEVAKYFGWTNYTQMSADVKRVNNGWTKGQDAASIYPQEHQNNKEMYLAACEDNHLTPRFEKWVDHPNYMKLVNETRMAEAASQPLQPVFNTEAALESLEQMKKQGGYYVPVGGSVEEMLGIAEEIAEKLPKDARYSLSDGDDNARAAKEFFGTTNDWVETGYLLRDGQKLDFSGRHDGAPGGARYVDHRDIRDALGLDYGGDDYSGSMVQFMSEGNIRIMPETKGINLSVAPTKAQEFAIRDYIDWANGEVIVDLDTPDGTTVASVEYPAKTSSSRVLQDIREYFTEGKIPVSPDIRYSISDALPFDEQVRQTLHGGLQLEGVGENPSALYVMKEPTALLQEVGFGDYPLVITQNHVQSITAQRWDENGQILPGADHNHQIPEELFSRLPELIQRDVAAIFKADPRGERTRGSVILLTTQTDAQGNPIVIALRPNGVKVTYDGIEGPAHIVTSVYGRENFQKWLENQARHSTILYVNEKKAHAVPVSTFGASFASWYAGINPQGFDTIIGQRDATVNRENAGRRRYSISPEFREWFIESEGLDPDAKVDEARVQRALERKNKQTQQARAAAKSREANANLGWRIYSEQQLRLQKQKDKAKLREALGQAREEKRSAVAQLEEIAAIEKALAVDETGLGWQMGHLREMRELKRSEKARREAAVQAERSEAREQRKLDRQVSEVEKDIQHQGDVMAEKRMAAKRLGIREDAYTRQGAIRRDNLKLRRNAAKAALRSHRKVAEIRARQEIEQGTVDTIRRDPQAAAEVNRLQESAGKLRTLGRSAYRGFVSDISDLERFGKRQVSSMRADTLATVYRGANTTVESLYKVGLFDRSGNRVGDSMQDVFLVKDAKGKVDTGRQALLQDYMLHRHNIDRMSFESRAREALETFEAENPWLAEMDKNEFARLVAMTDHETAQLGKEQARSLAQEYYLLLKRVTEARNKPIFADSEGQPITAETSRLIVEDYEANNDWLQEKAQGIYDWWDQFMRIWAVGDSLSLEQYEQMRSLYPSYVPTYRIDKDGVGGVGFVGMGGATIAQAVKRAKGGTSTVMNIEDSFANIAQKIVRQARLNEVYKNILDTLKLDEDGTFGDFGYYDWVDTGESDGADVRGLLESETEQESRPALTKEDGLYKLTAWEDGKKISAFISEDLFKSIYNLSGQDSKHWFYSGVTKVGNKLTGPMKTAITGVNPMFALRNISRDFPTAVINSVSGLAFPKYYAQAALDMAAAGALSKDSLRWVLSHVNADASKLQGRADRWNQFKALGGVNSGYYNNESGFAKQMSTGLNAGQKALSTLGAFNEATEAMTRFAEYLATIERFGDTYENRLQGIKNAAEVTVDFGRRGSVGKVLNAWIPYWNPAMQGMSRLIRSVAEGNQGHFDARKALGTVGRAGMMVVLPQALIMAAIMAAGRKDEWEQFDDRTKDTYYLIPLADHQWLKVPKNREWGAILGAPLMRMWEAANGRDDAFETYLETSIIPNFLPGGPLDIVGLSQAVDLLTNEDFAGRSIVPYSLAQGSRGEQWDGDTSLVSKWFADLWNAAAGDALTEALGAELTASPMQLDYILGDYFGDFADIFRQWTSVSTWSGDDPVRSMADAALGTVTTPWIANELRSNQAVGDYYDLLDRLAKEVQDASTEDSRNGTELKEQSTAYQAQKAIQKLYGDRITELYGLVNSTPDEAEQNEYRSEIVALAGEALRYYEDIQSGKIQHPILEANYADLPGDVSDELIRLDGMTEDYSFLPITSVSKTYTVPGQKYHQYELTDEQRQQFKDLYMEVYGQTMSSQIQSAAYQQASDAAKAEMLEAARDTVLEQTKEQFFLDLEAQGVASVQKELPMELPTEVSNELYRLDSYSDDYSFTPTGSASDAFTDLRRSDKEYVLTAEQKLQYKSIYQEVYGELMSALMAKSRYKSAKDAKKAAMLEEERDKVLEETKDRFYDWLKETGAEPVDKE